MASFYRDFWWGLGALGDAIEDEGEAYDGDDGQDGQPGEIGEDFHLWGGVIGFGGGGRGLRQIPVFLWWCRTLGSGGCGLGHRCRGCRWAQRRCGRHSFSGMFRFMALG